MTGSSWTDLDQLFRPIRIVPAIKQQINGASVHSAASFGFRIDWTTDWAIASGDKERRGSDPDDGPAPSRATTTSLSISLITSPSLKRAAPQTEIDRSKNIVVQTRNNDAPTWKSRNKASVTQREENILLFGCLVGCM